MNPLKLSTFSRARKVCFALLPTFLMVAAGPAFAGLSIGGQYSSNLGSNRYGEINYTATSLFGEALSPDFSAHSRAEYGSVGAAAVAVARRGDGLASSGNAYASAWFTDSMTITSSEPIGTVGELSLQLALSGSLSTYYSDIVFFEASSLVQVRWAYQAYPPAGMGGQVLTGEGLYAQAGGSTSGNFSLREFSETIPANWDFYVGGKIGFSIEIYTEAKGHLDVAWNPRLPAGGKSEFLNTIHWGGITAATDSNGAHLSDVSVTSESGTNYAVAVPEPGAVALGVLGLVVTALKRRRPARA